jgi:hypothetical protein
MQRKREIDKKIAEVFDVNKLPNSLENEQEEIKDPI